MVLALVLAWLRGCMKQETMVLLFGATAATISRAKRYGLGVLYRIFTANPNDVRWKISWPSPEEMNRFANMVEANTTNLSEAETVDGVFGFMDGLNLQIHNPVDPDEQNAYYNGCLSGTYCSQVLIFTPDGRICFVNSNRPGSNHDARIAIPLYRQLLTPERCPGRFRLLADSAFPCTGAFKNKILSVPKEGSKAWRRRNKEDAQKCAVVTKHRQAAEWGMRSLQASFGRLHLPLSTDTNERQQLLAVIWYLHNFRVHAVGINQIRTVYYKKWARNINNIPQLD